MFQLRGIGKYGEDSGELVFHSDAKVALEHFIEGNFWKMSWTLPSGRRLRLLKDGREINITYIDEILNAAKP